jgi:uncharacterized protein
MARRSVILNLALITLIGMPLGAILIDRFSQTVHLPSVIIGYRPLWEQLLVGVVFGLASAFSARSIASSRWMSKVSSHYSQLLGNLHLTRSDIWLISVCAGIGEELLFRGALQPLLGIVPTSIIFVAIHGYLNPSRGRLIVYGLFMTVIISIMGFMTIFWGIIPAIIAHTLIDVVLLHQMQDAADQQDAEATELEEN